MTGPARLWGAPTPDPSADDGFDFSRRNGGVHAVQLNGSGARDVIPTGAITTGKQLASDGAGSLPADKVVANMHGSSR
jgi:hypothetical protein